MRKKLTLSQEKYFLPKRTKPSLSIVNPLDVLRQRVMLEMARRQRENSNKQAEINKEILKSIGKRGNSIDNNDIEEYLRNRYDPARLYKPLYNSKNSVIENFPPLKQRSGNSVITNQSTKFGEEEENEESGEAAVNGLGNGKAYIINDSNNNVIDDDNSQLKYVYSFYKNRLSSII
ncbi:CLUMA_CG011502, isoform A [Clunio marinus]|uniref:CLUMA_CG011502, isoform A n=1 Tax=Clunio marinus TaxID=568069 RepID=A0A1J1IGG4_9DIPT|nr:CLUMA_CG011502, isoform A [Clunio marinus]